MQSTDELLRLIAFERPLGSQKNNEILRLVEEKLAACGYELSALPLDCLVWTRGASSCLLRGRRFCVAASPYSRGFEGEADFVAIRNLSELAQTDCRGKIVVLLGQISAEPLQPKDYPFYYPNGHREIVETLENSGCAAILAVTGRHPACGLKPFPLFADGNFAIPSAYLDQKTWRELEALADSRMLLSIKSGVEPAQSRQPIALKRSARAQGKVTVCAHMDSQPDTPGALDNAAGLVMLLRLAELVRERDFDFDLEFVPFNSEEYFGAVGELAYLERLERDGQWPGLLVNIDSPCHLGSKIAVAAYNFGPAREKTLAAFLDGERDVVAGQPWQAGDHAPFAMRGLPCLTVASSDFFSGGLDDTHTPRDSPDQVDAAQIESGAVFLAGLMCCF